jgi:Sel1 repeat
LDLESTGPILSSPIQPAKDLDAPLPSVLRAHEKPPVVPVAADEFRIEWPPQSLGLDAAGPMFSGELVAYLRHRSSLAPELVLEPKPLEVDRTRATALRVSGVTAIAALVAWALVSLPGVGQRPGNNNFHTAVPPNPGSGTARPAAAAIAAAPASSSSTVSQSEKITSRPDDEDTSTLIKLGQDFLKNGDFSSARLLLRRAAKAGSAAATLSLGETFDPFLIQRLGAIGVQPDVAEAREWYQRAAQLGSNTAAQHLAKLAAHQ